MAARELRYDAFRLLKAKWKAEAIAVGHHKDDNIETFLLNLSRGTGIKGLCGMQPKNDDVIRPLLCLTRQEILEHLRLEGLEHMTDHTNLEDDYARNKVRLNVLPLLESINKGAMHNITSTIENLNEVQNVYRQAISAAIKECCIQKENGETHIIINRLLQQAFEKTVSDSDGIVMKNPLSGNYTSSYLVFDMNNDNIDEAFVFYSDLSEDNLACVSIFKIENDDWSFISKIK